jgi:hypothetical protein
MRPYYLLIFILLESCSSFHFIESSPYLQEKNEELSIRPLNRCSEIWGYLMVGEEKELKGTETITDLCCFSAELNFDGKLKNSIRIPETTIIHNKIRTHLVVANISNSALL